MPLLNDTTRVAVDQTVSDIQKCLPTHEAKAILCEYDENGHVIALSFKVSVRRQDLAFRLPSDWQPVLLLLNRARKVPRRVRTQEQALHVSWRIIKD